MKIDPRFIEFKVKAYNAKTRETRLAYVFLRDIHPDLREGFLNGMQVHLIGDTMVSIA